MSDSNDDYLPPLNNMYNQVWSAIFKYFGKSVMETDKEIEETIRVLAYVLADLTSEMEPDSFKDVADIFNFYLNDAIRKRLHTEPEWAKEIDMNRAPN